MCGHHRKVYLKGKSNINCEFICVTMVDPAMSMMEIEGIPAFVSVEKNRPPIRSLVDISKNK